MPATLIAAAFFLGTWFISQWEADEIPYRVGQRIDRDIASRVTFVVEDETETERRRKAARSNSPNVYALNEALLDGIHGRLNQLLTIAKEHRDDPEAFARDILQAGFEAGPELYDKLMTMTTAEGSGRFTQLVRKLMTSLQREYVVRQVERTAPVALLRGPGDTERRVDAGLLQLASDTTYVTRKAEELVWEFPAVLQPIVAQTIVRAIQVNPDNREFVPVYVFDSAATTAGMAQAEAAVEPATTTYAADSVLVQAGILRATDIDLLREEQTRYLALLATTPELFRAELLHRIGTLTYILLIVVGCSAYTWLYEPRVARKAGRGAGMALFLLGVLLVSRALAVRGWPEIAIAAIFMAAALTTIVYNQRYALGITAASAALTCIVIRADLWLMLSMFLTGGLAVLLLRDIRTRSRIVSAGLLVALFGFACTVATGLVDRQDLREFVLPLALRSGLAILIAGFVLQGVLPLIERLFGVATSMTLLEWCDANKPLLRRLAQEAPGTYSHSLVVSGMAEAAAEAIGSNGLLARVGSLYHDIGKMHKPDYFVENQRARINRHDRLSPSMSLMIIRGHVKDGIELAREYGLPRVLWPFIEEHHGTTLVKYFLKVAADQQSSRAVGRHDRDVAESEFRYPGPRPHSKETAILMLCDGAEGTVRSLPEPNPARIEGAVHRLVMERLNDGQFDRCDITMNELRIIEETLVKVLCSIYHGRVAYPKDDRTETAARGETTTIAPAAIDAAAPPGRVENAGPPGDTKLPTISKQS